MSNNDENIKNEKLNRTLGLKRWLSFIVTLSMIMSLIILPEITVHALFSGGSGTVSSPYLISTANDLSTLATNVSNGTTYSGKYFKVTNNISYSGYSIGDFRLDFDNYWEVDDIINGGNIVSGINGSHVSTRKPFSGTFDGNGYVISSGYGLFSYTQNATIKNVGVICYTRNPRDYAGSGGIVDVANNTNVNNCYVLGNIKKYDGGGVVGVAQNGSITNCYTNVGAVSGGYSNCGAIAAYTSGTTISNCYYDTSTTTDSSYAGGGTGLSNGVMTSSSLAKKINAGSTEHKLVFSYYYNNDYPTFANAINSYESSYSINYPYAVVGQAYNSKPVVTGNLGSYTLTRGDYENLQSSLSIADDFTINGTPKYSNIQCIEYTYKDGFYRTNSYGNYLYFGVRNRSTDWSGAGTQTNPYIISSYDDLQDLYIKSCNDSFAGKYFKMDRDIDLSSWYEQGIGNWTAFAGNFDGGNHQICMPMYGGGIFERIDGAVISNLGINGYRSGYSGYTMGSIANGSENSTISNCFNRCSTASSAMDQTGGLVGYSSNCSFNNCYNVGSICGDDGVGGIVGYSGGGNTFNNCYNTGSLTEDDGEEEYIGSIAGGTWMGDGYDTYNNCYSLIAEQIDLDSNKIGSGLRIVSEDWMTSTAAIDALGSTYRMDVTTGNYGYPIFANEAANQKCSFSIVNPTNTYDGNAKAAIIRVNGTHSIPSSYYSVTYNGSTTAPTAVGSYTVKAALTTAGKKYYTVSDATETMTISKTPRSITTPTTAFTKNYGDEPFDLGATINVGSMTYTSSNTGVATVDSSGEVTIKGVGTTTITLASVANANYEDAANKTITVTVNGVKPNAPMIQATSGENGQSTITWTPPSNTGGVAITGYIIQRSEDGTNFETIRQPSSIDTRYVDSGLTNGKTYSYRMVAINSVGNSEFSSVATAKPYKVPEAVQGLIAETQGKHAIKLSWSNWDNGGDTATYNIKVYSDAEYTNEVTSSVTVGTVDETNKNVVISGLAKDTTYYFAVSATNKAGTGAITKIAGTTFTNPAAPTDLSAEVASATEIKLTWAAPEKDGGQAVKSYNVYYREKAAEGETANEWTKAGNTAELTYVVGELTPGRLYEFKVTAMNGETDEDESPDSAVIEIIPAKEPIAPVIGKLISGNASIEITSVEVSDNFGDAVNKYSIYVSRKNEDGSFGEYTKLSEVETKTDSSSNILASGLEICVKKVSKKDALFLT